MYRNALLIGKSLSDAAFVGRLPYSLRSLSRAGDLFASSCGGCQCRLVEKFSTPGTRSSFHGLVCSNHILLWLAYSQTIPMAWNFMYVPVDISNRQHLAEMQCIL